MNGENGLTVLGVKTSLVALRPQDSTRGRKAWAFVFRGPVKSPGGTETSQWGVDSKHCAMLHTNWQLCLAKDTRKLDGLELKLLQVISECYALKQRDTRQGFPVQSIFPEQASVIVVLRAAEDYLAAVIVVEMEFEDLCFPVSDVCSL